MSGTVLGSTIYEIGIDDSKFTTGLDNAERKAGGSVSAISSIGSKLAVFGLAAGGVKVLTSAIGGFLSDAMESQKVSAQTEAVIKSTGGAAGLTAQQVGDLATSLSKVAPIDDETIQSAENMLLTFTNIGKNVFPDATKAALDMSTALGTDPVAAATMLGKALQDPIAGVSALQRVGVRLTDQQKEQVKAMMAAGDTAGAQGVILQELQKEFGGSAEAAGKTFGGQMTILNTKIGNVKESIGLALIPAILLLVGWFTKAVDKAQPFIELLQRHGKPVLIGVAAALTALVVPALASTAVAMGAAVVAALPVIAIAAAIGLAAAGLYELWSHNFLGIQDVTDRVFGWFADNLPPIWAGIQAGIQGVVDFVTKLIHGDWLGAWTDLSKLVDNAKTLLTDTILPGLWAGIQTFFTDTLPKIGAALLEWGGAFVSWIAPQIPPLLLELGKLYIELEKWLLTVALPAIVTKLGEWGLAFIEWVGPQIPPLLLELGKLLASLGDWLITTALPEVTKKLAEWGLAFIAWVGPQIPPLLLELGKLLLALGKWTLETALPEIAKYLVQWGVKFIGWVADVVTKLPGELLHILEALGTWIVDNGPDIAAKGLSIGSSIVGGIADGIKDFIGSGLDAALQLLTDHIPGWAKKLLGISSPSKVMIPVGHQVSAGVAQGILDGIPAISAALGSMTDVISAVNVPPLGVGGMLPGGGAPGTGGMLPGGGGVGTGGSLMPGPGSGGIPGIGTPTIPPMSGYNPPAVNPLTGAPASPSSGGGASIQAAAARLERARNQLIVANQRLQAAFATGDPVQIAQMQYIQQQAILEYQAAFSAYQMAVATLPAQPAPPASSTPTPAPPAILPPPWESAPNPLDNYGPTGGAYQGAGTHAGGGHNRRGNTYVFNVGGRAVDKLMTDRFGNIVTRTLA